MHRPLVALTVLAAAGALTAGCDSNKSGSGKHAAGAAPTSSGQSVAPTSSGQSVAPTSSGQSGVATVMAASTKLGPILVDGSGRTLYLFEKDQPNQSACSGACVVAWPVDHTSATPKAGSGVQASLLGTIKRSDGTTQVTYSSHPLYYYAEDTMAGQLKGQGVNAFGAKWYVVAPTGSKVAGAGS